MGSDTVFRSEFERVYSKNNDVKTKKPTDKEIAEYLDLYVKFKLKVKEAVVRQMDTNDLYQGACRLSQTIGTALFGRQ